MDPQSLANVVEARLDPTDEKSTLTNHHIATGTVRRDAMTTAQERIEIGIRTMDHLHRAEMTGTLTDPEITRRGYTTTTETVIEKSAVHEVAVLYVIAAETARGAIHTRHPEIEGTKGRGIASAESGCRIGRETSTGNEGVRWSRDVD